MIQEQKKLWTSRCPGELEITNYRKNNWIISALKALNNEKIKICNHEIKDFKDNHRIKGGNIDLIELIEEKEFATSAQSRKSKNIMFLEDLLEADGITLLKWKHLCKEQGLNMKGKIPKWFKNLEHKLLADESGQVRKIKNEFIGQSQKENIHVNLFDENEKQDKSSIITWNDKGEFPIFSIDRKKSQSKKYKRIGIHLILVGDHYDLHNSPRLEECKGCYRNISKKKGNNECLIYIENEISRKIDRRKEENDIKPYETLNNIIKKNEWLRSYTIEEKRDELYNKKIELIDKIIKTNEENFTKLIKNSIFEENQLNLETKQRFCILIDIKKKKWDINVEGKRIYSYNVIWKIFVLDTKGNTNEELIFLANHECNNENEFKLILRSIIVGILLISENSEVILGINEKVNRLIFEFINNFSNRKKIDSEFYLELLFLEEFLEMNNIELIEENEKIYRIIKEKRKEMQEMLKNKNIINTIKYNFELIDEGLTTNEYNLIWNNRLITGGFRSWRKSVTNAMWKNEILNSEKLEDLFMYNYRKEFDWITSLEFISNRVEFSQRQCGAKDTIDRSYRIKNLLKEQPTYKILYKRNTNKIDTDKCIRCGKKEQEDWEHIWTCEDNEFSIDEIIRESPYKFEKILLESNQSEELDILRNYNCEFINIIESPSNILLGKGRKWEVIRGIYNNKFNDLSKEKKVKDLIKKLWIFTYEEIKKRIWIPRCEEIKRLEDKAQIKKSDLRRKRDGKEILTEEFRDIQLDKIKKQKTTEKLEEKTKKIKLKKQISIVTLDKMKGSITDGNNIARSWDTTIKIANS
ncbi:hypothetical protein GLOIN_2v1771092 [Rhizophagus irregularis DAOM 181602=DAOM 197198]|nr:hypothetical protein RirG_057130 [Rhizophagus irregularis DAOM 197198w]GBC41342.1 hypothetical protein GLOIN_2v1771092 [Rhizophagus irregularis DAOM 181602=DAOM 197198]